MVLWAITALWSAPGSAPQFPRPAWLEMLSGSMAIR